MGELKESHPGKAFSILKDMGAQPGDCSKDKSNFKLLNHENLDNLECANRIGEHFAAISHEYDPIDINSLPDRVTERLRDESSPKLVSEFECYQKLLKAKKPKSVVPGDLPSAIIKEFIVELAKPLSLLYNNVIQQSSWPNDFKIEYVTPVSKVDKPKDENDLRPIALTPFFSKVLEQFVVGVGWWRL